MKLRRRAAGGVELEGEAGFREVDLNGGGAGVEGSANVFDGFGDEVDEEGAAGVAGDLLRGIEEAEGGGRDDGLLEGALGVGAGGLEVARRVDAVAEGEGGEAGELAGVAVGEGDDDAVGGEVGEAGEGVGGEAGLGLLSVGEDGGAGLLEAGDGVFEGGGVFLVESFGGELVGLEGGDGAEERGWAGNAANGFGGECHGGQSSVQSALLNIHQWVEVLRGRRSCAEGEGLRLVSA